LLRRLREKKERKRKTDRGEERKGERFTYFLLLKKTIFKFIFQTSNFTQTRNHAFES
jgi:hypothetical protein